MKIVDKQSSLKTFDELKPNEYFRLEDSDTLYYKLYTPISVSGSSKINTCICVSSGGYLTYFDGVSKIFIQLETELHIL